MLLALDNFEQVLDAAPVVNELLGACPRLVVLVTSRAALHLSGEQLVLVPPLPAPDPERALPLDQLRQVDAVRLFVERARSARDDFVLSEANAALIAGICARLDGVPLALELAAARLRVLSPRALLAHLEHRLRLLTGGPHDQPVRLQTMRDTIAWSYDLLGPNQQRLFRQLAVFVGGWTLEAAEAVCGGDLDVLDGLDVLVDHSLVGQIEQPDGSGRFGMLETVREYALEQLEASGEAAAIRACHASAYLALAEAQHPMMVAHEATGSPHNYLFTTRADLGEHEFGAWLARMESEQDNLRAALAWLLDTRADERALRLAVALGTFW
jgi:predicted ATPase